VVNAAEKMKLEPHGGLTECQASSAKLSGWDCPPGSATRFLLVFSHMRSWQRACLHARRKGEPFMEMLLMGICISVFGMAIAAAAFGAATRPRKSVPQINVEQVVTEQVNAAAPARFFVNDVSIPVGTGRVSVPIEALLLQLERHVRLEQAAAQSFIASPTPGLLHSKTVSPFLN
jgi:hypothetical protein